MTDVKRNKIKPGHNPWYLLTTLHGEAEYSNDELHARNRTAWNRFTASELTEEACEFLVKEGRCSAEDLVPFSPEALADIEQLFFNVIGRQPVEPARPELPLHFRT